MKIISLNSMTLPSKNIYLNSALQSNKQQIFFNSKNNAANFDLKSIFKPLFTMWLPMFIAMALPNFKGGFIFTIANILYKSIIGCLLSYLFTKISNTFSKQALSENNH